MDDYLLSQIINKFLELWTLKFFNIPARPLMKQHSILRRIPTQPFLSLKKKLRRDEWFQYGTTSKIKNDVFSAAGMYVRYNCHKSYN